MIGSIVYLHVLEPEDGIIVLPDFGKEITSAKLLHGDKAVRYEKQEFGTVVFVPHSIQDPVDTIIVLETR